MASPLVSVVIPSYNHRAYIREAVDSVLSQEIDLELIICDDASIDGTWEALQEIRDSRLRLLRNETNLGAHATLERVLDEARAPYLAILNSDDRFLPGRLQLCVDRLRNEEADLVGTDIHLIDFRGCHIQEHWWCDAFAALKQVRLSSGDWVATLLEGNVFMTTSNFVMTRELWLRQRPFSAHRYVHDYEFLLRILRNSGRLAWIQEALLEYRLHESNTISEHPLAANQEAASLLREHAPALLASPGDVSMRMQHLNSQWSRIERYEIDILRSLQHEALVRKDAEWKKLVDDRDRWIVDRDRWIGERDQLIAERDQWIIDRDRRIAMLDQEVSRFRQRPLYSALRIYGGAVRQRLTRLSGKLGQLRASRQGRAVQRVTSFSALRRHVEKHRAGLDVLSFDVFDTLLARCVEPPDQVIQRVARLLAQRIGRIDATDDVLLQRRLAEQDLRQRASRAGLDHECHHDELVQAWVARLLPSAGAAEREWLCGEIEQLELELESLALSAKPNARLFLEWARVNGLRIIAVSDMYLGERHLRQLLDRLGYAGLIDRIYVSSEHRIGKYSARLFEHVMQQENVSASRLLHVGDNFHSDSLAPARLGIAGVFLDERHERRRRRRQQVSARMVVHGGVWPGRMLAEVLAERLRMDERAKRDEFYFQYGLEVLGPIFSVFILGLIERVRRDQPQKVYFLARDGALFMRMYEAAAGGMSESLPPAAYAYASRRVVACAAVAEGLDHDKAVVGLFNPKQRGLSSILKTYGLEPADFLALAREHGFERVDERLDDWNDPRLLAFLADPAVQDRIRPAGIEARSLLHDYFAGLGFFDHARVALVDIGWNATIQRFMEQAFADGMRYPEVFGYYFAFMNGIHRGPLRHGEVEGLLLDRRRNMPQERAAYDFEELFEQGARALHATTIGYRRVGNDVLPVLKDDDAEDRRREIESNPLIESLQQGVMLCLEHFLAAQRLTGHDFAALKPYAMALAERAVAYPSLREVEGISRLAHTEDFGHDDLLDLSASHIRWLDFLRPRRLMKSLGALPWRYAPFARFRTPLASAVARAMHIIQLQRRGQ